MNPIMALKVSELVSILLSAFVAGMFFGPWVALSISIKTFEPAVFLAIVHRLNRNMAAVMTVLMPFALLSITPVLFFSYNRFAWTFYLNVAALFLSLTALFVTIQIEVPIVKQIVTWTVSTLPTDWKYLRDRWSAFHIVRVSASVLGLALLIVGAIFE